MSHAHDREALVRRVFCILCHPAQLNQLQWNSGHDESVEVNQRALIDKVLARYSGEFTGEISWPNLPPRTLSLLRVNQYFGSFFRTPMMLGHLQ